MKHNVKRGTSLALAVLMGISLMPANQMQAKAASTVAVVKTQKGLTKALKSKQTKTIRVVSTKKVSLTIPSGKYTKKTLYIDAGKATVVNKGAFAGVSIKNAVLFTEKAKSNKITVTDSKLTLKINGSVSKVIITKKSNLTINGSTKKVVTVVNKAKGSKMKANVKINLTTSKDLALTLEKNAKGSKVTATKNTVNVTLKNNTGKKITINKPDKNSSEETDDEKDDVVPGTSDDESQNDNSTVEKPDTDSSENSDEQKDDVVPGTTDDKSQNNNSTVEKSDTDLSYDGYELKWQDDFNGNKLNSKDWNVETHEAGWVNSELQSYENSSKNIYVKDGKLVLKPIKTGEGKDATYTSGRVNTQGKHDFTYGLFECVAKVPTGKGFLPAFWMMPTDENLYGQWPKCGEIDIMEVMGQETDKLYGTIHYGEPHAQSQGTYQQAAKDFANSYHKFSCEWEPGKITWYVDGIKFHEESDWYSAKEGQGEVTYPAPFDQPFYMILNLAVGGSWVGNPDDTTDINSQAYMIDSVKVYQKKAGYDDSNVKKPVKEVVIRKPDANGNYIVNGDFKEAEALDGSKNWQFLETLGGQGKAAIENGQIKVDTKNAGTADYSIQLVQPNIPAEQGGTYKVTFDAYADADRTMKVDVSAPDRGYNRYLNDTVVDLTKEKKTYEYTYTMNDKNDANARLEFNLGNTDSTATVYISNVKVEKTAQGTVSNDKKVLADGNYVYNGSFQEGDKRLGYWDVTMNDSAKATAEVTDLSDGRRLKVTSSDCMSAKDVTISQKDLAFNSSTEYELSFSAQAKEAATVSGIVAGKEFSQKITTDKQTYTYKFATDEKVTAKDFEMYLGLNGTVYIDDIRVVEDAKIKNGSFDAGFTGYDVYVDGSADASAVVDSQHEDNAADFTIKNTGDQDWKIQLKQSNIALEKDKWYKLSFDIKSSIDRSIQYSIQRDGSKHNDDWTPYVQDVQDLTAYGADGEYTHVEKVFKMSEDTDKESVFNIALGAVGGKQITDQHRVCIDNIVLEETEEQKVNVAAGTEMIKNGDFANGEESWEKAITAPGAADVEFKDNKATYKITNVGTADWNVQLKQGGLTLEKGASYTFKCKMNSTAARTAKVAFLTPTYAWYGGADVALNANETKDVSFDFTVGEETCNDITLVLSMGLIDGVDTPLSDITISDVSLVKNK